MADLFDNPMGTDGFEFIEYTATDPAPLRTLFHKMGFPVTARHRNKNITLHQQAGINFIINAEPDSFAQQFARQHGPSVCAIAFRVKNAASAWQKAVGLGARAIASTPGPMELNIPAIEGVGGTRIYLVDRYGERNIYDVDFEPVPPDTGIHPTGLTYIDHLTNNVFRGNIDQWSGYYQRLFNFRELKTYDIEGKLTGLKSRAMTSPCGKIRIPVNESSDDKSQIEEYLHEHHGEGIQHIALGTDDIYSSVDALKRNGIIFQPTPDSYYDNLDVRLPGHGEDAEALRKRSILIDGAPVTGDGILLQIFTRNVIGPIFFEIIQRKGNEGFGEGNITALFESVEQDQIQRGILGAR